MKMVFYGVGLEVKVKELLLQVKMQIQYKPGNDIRYLKVIFKRFNINGNGKPDPRQKKSDLICAKRICLFASSYYFFALLMNQKQRIKEDVLHS